MMRVLFYADTVSNMVKISAMCSPTTSSSSWARRSSNQAASS